MPMSDLPFIASTVSPNISDQTFYVDNDQETWNEYFQTVTYTSFKIILSLQAVFIIAPNLFLLVVLLSKSSLRRCLRNQLLISMAVSNLMDGIFGGPFVVDFLMRDEWIHSCYLIVVHTLLSRYTHNCIIVWGMVLLVVSYLCRLKSYGGPAFFLRMSLRIKKSVAPLLLVLLPWIIAFPLTFSIVLSGVPDWVKTHWYNSFCLFFVEQWAEITMNIFIVVIPVVLMIVFVVLSLVIYRRRTVICGAADQNTILEGPSVHVAAVVLCIIMSVSKGLNPYIMESAPTYAIAFMIAGTLFCISNMIPFVLALLWLLVLKDLRAHACEILDRISVRFCKLNTSGASTLVTLSNLSEEV